MVAVTIRSAEDIAFAYLQAMGYSPKEAAVAGELIMQKFKAEIEESNDVVAVLDRFLSAKAKEIFGKSDLNDVEAAAAFKAAMWLGEIKSAWKENLFKDKSDDGFAEELRRAMPKNAPQYALSMMKAQRIDPISPKSWLGKFFK